MSLRSILLVVRSLIANTVILSVLAKDLARVSVDGLRRHGPPLDGAGCFAALSMTRLASTVILSVRAKDLAGMSCI